VGRVFLMESRVGRASDAHGARPRSSVTALGGDGANAGVRALEQVEAFFEAAEPLCRRRAPASPAHHLNALLYSIHTDEVCILAVAYQRRRPLYWEGRR
jgi:hypothetical protein